MAGRVGRVGRLVAAGGLLFALAGGGCGGGALSPFVDPLDPRRDPALPTPVLSFVWKRRLEDRSREHRPQEFASAVTRSGDLYVGTQGGDFFALRASDGKVLWKRRLGSVSSRPLVDDPRLYVGTDDGSLLSVNAFDGTVNWRHATRGAIQHPPVAVGDLLVFSNDADHVFAVDRGTGKLRWQYERETPEEFTMRGHAGVAVAQDRVFAGFSDGHVVALTATSGEVVWVRSLAGESEKFVDVDTTPVIDRGILYAASASGGLYALDPSDGTEKWRFDVKGAGTVAVDGDSVYFAAADEGLFALDLRGNLLWRQGLRGAGDPSRPLVQGPYLFFSVSEEGLAVVDKRTGELLQLFDPGPGISSEPTLNGDRLYVLSNGAILYAFDVDH